MQHAKKFSGLETTALKENYMNGISEYCFCLSLDKDRFAKYAITEFQGTLSDRVIK